MLYYLNLPVLKWNPSLATNFLLSLIILIFFDKQIHTQLIVIFTTFILFWLSIIYLCLYLWKTRGLGMVYWLWKFKLLLSCGLRKVHLFSLLSFSLALSCLGNYCYVCFVFVLHCSLFSSSLSCFDSYWFGCIWLPNPSAIKGLGFSEMTHPTIKLRFRKVLQNYKNWYLNNHV